MVVLLQPTQSESVNMYFRVYCSTTHKVRTRFWCQLEEVPDRIHKTSLPHHTIISNFVKHLFVTS